MMQIIWDYLSSCLRYADNSPMIFTGMYFWVFFTFVFVVFSVLQNKITLRNLFLFLVSIFFYYKTSGLYFILLLFTISSDFIIGKILAKSESIIKRKLLLITSIIINLSILFYFKYAYFFTESYNSLFHSQHQVWNYFAKFSSTFTGTGSITDRILLPVGISFYTFQTISYTVDIYRNKIKPLSNFFDFGFYVSFFPQLVAGPIVRAAEFIPQMYKPYKISSTQFGMAVFLILTGLIKKMVFSDYMAVQFIDKVYANPLIFTGFENLMAVLCYSLQVYLDFSGYTDIAIGVALLLGFKFNINFNSPYKATSVEDFWKRWHISLSTWLRDYLYFPLGGNRNGTIGSYVLGSLVIVILILLSGDYSYFWKIGFLIYAIFVLSYLYPKFKKIIDTNINLMITMLLGGLWHGASANFLTWGGLNGLGLIFYKYWKKISPYEKLNKWYVRAFKIVLTFTFISFTRIWFRSADGETASIVLHKILSDIDWSLAPKIVANFYVVFMLFSLGMIIHWLPLSVKRNYRHWFIRSSPVVKVAAVLSTVILIWQTISAEFVPFIYFQF